MLMCALVGARLGAQESAEPRNLAVRVVTETERVPLGYSVVAAPALGLERFTGASGSVVLPIPAAGPVRLRIKRLGFTPKDTTVLVSGARTQSVTIALARVSFRLEEVRVVAWPPCEQPGIGTDTDGALRGIVDQLRQNAERFRLLITTYPFLYTMQRQFGERMPDGSYVASMQDVIPVNGTPEWTYRPGTLVAREPRSTQWVMRIPQLSDLAEEAFVDNHCFHVAGLEEKEGKRLLRLDIVAADALRDTDVNVSVWLDPEAYQLRHATFTLTKPPRAIRGLISVTSTVRYREVIPFVPVMELLVAENVSETRTRGKIARKVFIERQTIQDLIYRSARPDSLLRDTLP
jgi:hypothetical protein